MFVSFTNLINYSGKIIVLRFFLTNESQVSEGMCVSQELFFLSKMK